MENFIERLNKLIKDLSGGNVTDFAKKSGIKQATLHNYTKGRHPNAESLYNICNNLNVDLNWLVTGKGEPYLEDKEADHTHKVDFAEYPAKVRDLPPELIIQKFKQKELARQVTWNLLKLEEIDSREVLEINRYIEYRTYKAIENRRNESTDPDGFPEGQDRRCGKDRRKLA